ncbi:unnamed protein product [Amoebophrya sp. A120]|nr:unnamed protein product [Amoebophrya sp. A120]|eukprot:GSA120T00023869001.1
MGRRAGRPPGMGRSCAPCARLALFYLPGRTGSAFFRFASFPFPPSAGSAALVGRQRGREHARKLHDPEAVLALCALPSNME